ncbi:MAG: hypothetical protein M3A44_15520 [Gammaproteobacteria bacterium]
MTNYHIKNSSMTLGSISIAGILATQLLALPSDEFQKLSLAPNNANYVTPANSHTFGQYANIFTGEFDRESSQLEVSVSLFYAKLLAHQEPLGKEFEEALYDNLWDLYAR